MASRSKRKHWLSALSAIAVVLNLTWCLLPAMANDPIVVINTTKGPIAIRVFMSMVPYSARNFLHMVNSGFYDGTFFHRVESWVVQGGDPIGDGTGVYVDPESGQPRKLRLEIHPKLTHNSPGMVAFARGNDPNSASCQFYILRRGQPVLNGKYTVFGKVLNQSSLQTALALRRGDRIMSASIADAAGGGGAQRGPGWGGGDRSGGGGSNQQAVPYVESPNESPPPPPHGDPGF